MVSSGVNADQVAPPYKGLHAFRFEDSHKFFGRREESREIIEMWQANRLTILYGASGIGKTSLLRAGVIPRLDPGKTDILPLGRVSYGSTFPRAALPAHNPYVLALLLSWSPLETPTRLAGMSLSSFLRSRPAKRDANGEAKLTLMTIDQVEELFTGPRRLQPYREWLFDQLTEALRADLSLRVLLSVRSDRLIDLMPLERELSERLARDSAGSPHLGFTPRFQLEALNPDDALEAVTLPLTGTDRVFAREAAEQLVEDLMKVRARFPGIQHMDGVEPVHLQVVCTALWNALPSDTTTITAADVSRYANVDEALSEHYDRVLREIAAERFDGDDFRLRSWLRRTFATRTGSRSLPQQSVKTSGIGARVISLLVKEHVLRADRQQGESCYELAYDRLLQSPAPGEPPAGAPSWRPRTDECLGLAKTALRDGDYAQAHKRAKEALARAKNDDLRLHAEIESLLGNVAFEQGRAEEAISHYRTSARHFERTGAVARVGPLLTAIGRLRLTQGMPKLAVRELHAAMARVPADLAIQTELAWALWHDGHPHAAVDVLNDVLNREGNNADALLTRGQILAGMGQAGDALRDLERVRPLQWPFAKVAHALALAQRDRLEEAQQEMVEALRPNVDRHGPLLLYAAKVEELAGKKSSAMDFAQRAIDASEPALPKHLADDAKRLVGSR